MKWSIVFNKLAPFCIILLICFLFNRYIWWATDHYGIHTYHSNIISLQSIEFILFLIITALLSFVIQPKKRTAFSPHIRLMYGLPLLLLTLFFIVQAYNFFFESYFLIDRIFLFVLMLLSIYRPLFLGPYLILLILIHHQYDFPLGMHPYPDKRLSLSLLIVSYAAFAYQYMADFIQKHFNISYLKFDFKYIFHFSFFYVFIASYFFTAVHKISISPTALEWLMENEVINNITAMMNRGWLQSFEPSFTQMIKDSVLFGSRYFQFFVLLLEILVLFLFLGRKYAILIIFLLMCMHLFIFIGNGGLFIHWILIGAMLIFLIKKEKIADDIWTKKSLFGVIILIPLALISIKPVKLGWYDSALDNYFEIRLKTAENIHLINPKYIKPYAAHLLSGTFLFVSREATLSPGFVNSNYQEIAYINRNKQADSLLNYIIQNGKIAYDEKRSKEVELFLRKLKKYLSKGNPEKAFQKYLPIYMNAISTHTADWVEVKAEDSLQLVHVFTYMDKGKTTKLKERIIVVQ